MQVGETIMSSPSFLSQFIIAYSHHWFPTTGQSWLESPQILVERLATAVVALQLLQFVLYHARFGPRSSSSVRRWCAWAAFYGPVPLAALAVAAMLRLRWCPYWLVAVFFAAEQADTVAAYSLRDADRRSVRRFAKRALSLAYLALAVLVVVAHGDGGAASISLRRKEVFSLVLGFLLVLQDLNISRKATIPPSEICKVAADHVRFPARRRRSPYADYDDWVHHRRSVVAVGPLGSYRSAVSGCTTLEDIYESRYCNPCSPRMQDACLSSALFLQLLERHGNAYDRPQVLERSSANHAFRDVLAEASGSGWERAFGLVEVQLSFMRDYFFSAHGSPSRTSYRLYAVYSLLKIGFLLIVRSLAMEEEEKPHRVASASLHALILLETCQLVGYLMSNRFIVSYMCDRRSDLSGTVDEVASGFRDNIFVALPLMLLGDLVGISNWEVHLGRYSLVEDFDRTCMTRRLMARLLLGRRQQQPPTTPRDGSVKFKPHYSSSDRSWQFHRLKRWICGKAADPEGGSRFAFGAHFTWSGDSYSLRRLSWTLDMETKIHTILIWHVATWFCDMSLLPRTNNSFFRFRDMSPETVQHLITERIVPGEYTFATMLSSYCAYLVAFRPELLHEHPSLTRSIFEEAVKGAESFFNNGAASSEERYAMAKTWRFLDLCEVERPGYRGGIFQQGIWLGQQLMERGSSSERWKIMADFWAEMVLFVAQSGNAAAHVEHLATGDEFITQLWALLSNGWDRTFIRRRHRNDEDPLFEACSIL